MRLLRLIAAAGVSCGIAAVGYRARALTLDGAVAASLAGTATMYRFGIRGALILGTFFVSGSALSRIGGRPGPTKSSRARRARQVVANGGVAAMADLASRGRGREVGVAAMAGSLAAATSDTWATEFGIRSGQTPRFLLSGASVMPGQSGGVTVAGTLASTAGAAAVGLLSALLYRKATLGIAVTVGGVVGSTIDSLLGELVQSKRISPDSGQVLVDDANAASSIHASGWRWVDNDVVNLGCTLSGALTAAAIRKVAAGVRPAPTSVARQGASGRPSR